MHLLETTKSPGSGSPLLPEPIAIEIPVLKSAKYDTPGQMMTCLFPKYASLPEAQELLYDRAEDWDNMTVFSAGCSNGAVAYSLAGLHYRRGFGGRIKFVGYDKSYHAVKVALAGQYTLPFRNYVAFEDDWGVPVIDIEEDVKTLREYGFHVDDKTPFRDEKQELFGGHGFKINVRPLEKDNDFIFGDADLVKAVPRRRERSADLVEATGLLSSLEPDAALEFARNMGRIAKISGAVVFGEVLHPYLQNMGGPLAQDKKGRRTITYAHWMVEKLTRVYRREFGFEPVAFDPVNPEVPVAFAGF